MRGCPFHNAAVEASEVMPEIQDIVHEHKRAYIKGLIKLARQAGAANPTLLGNQLGLLYEGAAALSTSLTTRLPGHTHVRRPRRSSTKRWANRWVGAGKSIR